jgi:prefoldin subunit 5
MKGRYERSEDNVRALSAQVSELQRQVTQLQARPAAPAAPTPPAQVERLVTPEEEADYGAELLTVVGKKAQEQLNPIVAELKAQISSLQDQLASVGGVVAVDHKQRMFDQLDSSLSTWRETNRDPEFLSWLALPDPLSGVIRHDMLKAAFEAHNAPRVLAFFNGFLSQEAAKVPSGEPSPLPAPPPAAPQVRLEDLAAPGRARTAAPGSPPAEKPSFTRAQIRAFYRDINNGAYRGRDAERERLENDIFEATRAGRVFN